MQSKGMGHDEVIARDCSVDWRHAQLALTYVLLNAQPYEKAEVELKFRWKTPTLTS
jgi:hypothetical protein